MAVHSAFVLGMVEARFTGATIKALLVDDTYEFGDEETLADIDALGVEVTDAGYTAGGVALTNVAISYDEENTWVKLVADDLEWGPMTNEVQLGGVIFYIDTGTPATSEIVASDLEDGTVAATEKASYIIDEDGLLQFPITQD